MSLKVSYILKVILTLKLGTLFSTCTKFSMFTEKCSKVEVKDKICCGDFLLRSKLQNIKELC